MTNHQALQAPRAPLIGRIRDLAQLAKIVSDPDTRLVTITGVGGIGKTRLAHELIDQIAGEFPDGALFVDLAPIRDPRLIDERIADALGLTFADSDLAHEQIAQHLESAQFLIVLDNMEQLLDATPAVIDLLARCPDLVMVTTSRERLGVASERVFELRPLATPDQHASQSLEAVSGSEAVQLFLSCAAMADRDFEMTDRTAPDIAAICRRLDGLPLAIELAASRVAEIPPHLILRNFVHVLPFLERSASDPNARHRTMRDAIAWSVEQLPDTERDLFARISMFEGPFSLDAANALFIGDVDALSMDQSFQPDVELVKLLGSLVNKHLLVRRDWDGSDPRFAMLQTLREYGLDLLGQGDYATAVREQHGVYFTRLANTYRPHLLGPEPDIWIKRYEQDLAEFRSALRWYQQNRSNYGLAAVTLCNHLAHFWLWRGHVQEALRNYLDALAQAGDAPSPAIALGYMHLGHFTQKNHAQALSHYQRSFELYRQLGDSRGMAYLLTCLAMTTEQLGDYAKARAYLKEAIDRFNELGSDYGIASSLYQLGRIHAIEGRFPQGKKALDKARTLFEGLGDSSNTIFAISEMGRLYRFEGKTAEARKIQLWSLQRFTDEQNHNGRSDALCEMSRISLAEHDLVSAAAYCRSGIELLMAANPESATMAELLICMAAIAAQSDDPLTGARLLAAVQHWATISQFHPVPDEAQLIDATTERINSALGASAFRAAFNEGDLWTIEEAARTALGVVPVSPALGAASVPPAGNVNLTQREQEILCLIATAGSTNRQIAEGLHISERTVAVHVQNILGKLEAENRTHASALAFHAGVCSRDNAASSVRR